MKPGSTLVRDLGLAGLAATGICSMIGAAINIIPFTLQRTVPDIGPYVLAAYLLAAVPAVLAGMAYAMLASAMPCAGGSYVYASRGASPYLGFIASFSQWFGLSIAIGVVSYVLIAFLRDVALAAGWVDLGASLEAGPVRVGLALAFLWTFVGVNIRGLGLYQRTLIPLMILMFLLGGIVIVAGFLFDHADYTAALAAAGTALPDAPDAPLRLQPLFAAAALLFSSFIGFDSIAQAGGEARNPGRNLPLAIAIAIVGVGLFYFLFTAAVYHAVPWHFVAAEAAVRDVTAPGLLGPLLPAGLTILIVAGAAVALANDLPAMLLAVSRLMFAWAGDGIFPAPVARVHPVRHTPHVAIIVSGGVASIGILGSHFAGTFFLGIDILVTSMLVNFLLMCVTVLTIRRRIPELAKRITVFRSRAVHVPLAVAGVVILGGFLTIHTVRDLTGPAGAWYFRSTPVWLIVMALGTVIYLRKRAGLVHDGVDVTRRFLTLPGE